MLLLLLSEKARGRRAVSLFTLGPFMCLDYSQTGRKLKREAKALMTECFQGQFSSSILPLGR